MTRTSAQDRRLDVLRAIVTQYVATREPVGSKAIAAGGLGVSSATIRNDMAVLEEAGLIYQPHTSAGRVPTVTMSLMLNCARLASKLSRLAVQNSVAVAAARAV